MLSSKSPHSTILLNNLSVQFSLLKIIYYCTHKCMIHVAGAHVLCTRMEVREWLWGQFSFAVQLRHCPRSNPKHSFQPLLATSPGTKPHPLGRIPAFGLKTDGKAHLWSQEKREFLDEIQILGKDEGNEGGHGFVGSNKWTVVPETNNKSFIE